jgi:hypothetical protein
VFVLSFAWKITIPSNDNYDPKDHLVDFLKRSYPGIVVTDESIDFVPIIQATTGSCRLRIAALAFNGSTLDLAKHLAAGADRLFFVFHGRVYTQQPVLLTVIFTLWSEVLRKFGLVRYIPPVVAVAGNSSCDAERLPWSEARGVSGVR